MRTLLVDRDHAVGIAVERETGVGPVVEHRLLQRGGVRGAALLVDVGAVGRRVEHFDGRTQLPQRGGRGDRNDAPLPQSITTRMPSSRRPSSASTRYATYASLAPRYSLATPTFDPEGPPPGSLIARSRSSCSTRASSGSEILRPPGANSLTPLSANGLWLAEITAPGRAAIAGDVRDAGRGDHAEEHRVGAFGADARDERGLDHRARSDECHGRRRTAAPRP